MITCRTIRCKSFRGKSLFSAKSESDASVPLIGSLLLLLILFVITGAAFSSFLNSSGSYVNFQLPVININIESCEGGLYGVGPMDERVTLEENLIVIVHEGGSPLALDTTSLKIQGYGNSYQGRPGSGGKVLKGETSVFYTDLSSEKKNPDEYLVRNRATLKDGYWTAGEKLVLCGRDSAIGTEDSSVKVNVNGVGNTTDNYGFKAGSEITLVVIDTEGRNVLAKRTAVVEFAGE